MLLIKNVWVFYSMNDRSTDLVCVSVVFFLRITVIAMTVSSTLPYINASLVLVNG